MPQPTSCIHTHPSNCTIDSAQSAILLKNIYFKHLLTLKRIEKFQHFFSVISKILKNQDDVLGVVVGGIDTREHALPLAGPGSLLSPVVSDDQFSHYGCSSER